MASVKIDLTKATFHYMPYYMGLKTLSVSGFPEATGERQYCVSVPSQLNKGFEKGDFPFLPKCPSCEKQTVVRFSHGTVHAVYCPDDHYLYEPEINKHRLKEPGEEYEVEHNGRVLRGVTAWDMVPVFIPKK